MLIKDLPKSRAAHPSDLHPPLGVRLDAHGVNLAEVAESAKVIKPADMASSLRADIDKLNEALTRAQTAMMAHDPGQVR